jgi:F-type H+-transporting ATPase subunit gamma
MAKTRQIDKRLRAISNIRTIARTMEMVAFSRFQRVHRQSAQAQGAMTKLEAIAREALAAGPVDHPLISAGKGRDVLLLALTSNRGLCGGYNNRVMETVRGELNALVERGAPVRLHLLGKKGVALARARRFPAPDQAGPQFEEADIFPPVCALADMFVKKFISGELASVEVAYQRMESAAVHRPHVATLLPLEVAPPEGRVGPRDFLPARAGVLDVLLPMLVRLRLLRMFLDAIIGEQLARMVSMRAATTNANEAVHTLTLKRNRIRQTQITMELAEIMGGSEALRK